MFHSSRSVMFTPLLALAGLFVVFVNGAPRLDTRQSTPGAPSGWNSIGCYSDSAIARTLRTASFTDVVNMTLESCAAFCTPAGYQYAGLEFGRECYCDNTIESPGAPAMDGCNMACTGNSVELCGGADRISILNSTTIRTSAPLPPPPPHSGTIKPTVGTFQYKGCFQDGVNGAPRSLLNKVTVPGGVSAESCTTACKSMGYPLAGLEFGRECWCDTYMALAVHAPDSDCDKACEADSTEICGSGNRLTVYHDTIASPPDVQECLHNAQFSAFRFNLQAVPNAGGGAPVPIGTLELTARSGEPTFFVLSTAQVSGETFTYTLFGNDLRPDEFEGEGIPISIAPAPGGTQVFAAWATNPPYLGYCAKPNPAPPFGPFIGPPALSVSGHSDLWALCQSTNGGRTLVYSPIDTSPDYSISQCQSVSLQMTQPICGVEDSNCR